MYGQMGTPSTRERGLTTPWAKSLANSVYPSKMHRNAPYSLRYRASGQPVTESHQHAFHVYYAFSGVSIYN
jgi:hypothetical protein